VVMASLAAAVDDGMVSRALRLGGAAWLAFRPFLALFLTTCPS